MPEMPEMPEMPDVREKRDMAEKRDMTDPRDAMRWMVRGLALTVLVIGWVLIAWANHFHVTAPVVIISLGHLAAVVTIYNLWRTGAAVVDSSDDGVDSTWAKPAGALGELEREKRTLLKAIKEAEFDHQMGKLSQRDADEMIRDYRARAIEVIKEIDRLGLGAAGTVREQILREVRARVQLDGKAPKKAADGKASTRAGGKRAAADAATKPAPASEAAASGAAQAATSSVATAATTATGSGGGGSGADDRAATAAPAGEPGAAATPDAAAARVHVPSDEELDADSTTAIEPRHDDPAKEATP
jgi:hypothetical protein